MNRTIRFRGKRTDDGEWVYGYYVRDLSGGAVGDYIFNCPSMTEVVPETVGQFTGLTDINGREIYEGDIVAIVFAKNGKIISMGDVQFDCGVFGAEWTYNKENRSMVGSWGQRHNLRKLDDNIIDRIKVIGNIHEHKHLLTTK